MLESSLPESSTQFPFPGVHAPQTPDADQCVAAAKAAPLTDGGLACAELLAQALRLDPDHHEAQILQERLFQTFVPHWHFPMLGDDIRNAAYAQAIRAKVRPGDVVLDIGCGAGLTAMLAARAGAQHVYTCEHQPLIAQAARQVIAQNGLSDRITVLSKWSHEIVIGQDMPEPADVVISEIVDTVLLGEGAMATLSHAMARLAKPGARAIPEHGTLMAQPVESDLLMGMWRPARAEGFDLAPFQRLARVAQLTPHDFAACAPRPLGSAVPLFRFDFTAPDLSAGRIETDLTCSNAGMAQAILVSFEMVLARGIRVTNGLYAKGHWGRTAYLMDRPERVVRGDQIRICAQHDATQLSVTVPGVARAEARPKVQTRPAGTFVT